jgi:hypothetical protein
MILSNEQMLAILKELKDQTVHHNMAWYAEAGKVWVDLPNRTTVELSRGGDGGLTASVKRGSEEVLGRINISEAELNGEAAEVNALYEAAMAVAGRVVYAEIIDSIKFSSSINADAARKVGPGDSLLPEQATRVLKKMAGRWNLDYSRGKETASIREDGSYFIEGNKELKFRLVVLAVNEAKSAAEVAKDTPDGRRYQIEYLTITQDLMTGHAKHDGHKLVYRKLKG